MGGGTRFTVRGLSWGMDLGSKLRGAAWIYRERAKIFSKFLIRFRSSQRVKGRGCWAFLQGVRSRVDEIGRYVDGGLLQRCAKPVGQVAKTILYGARASLLLKPGVYLLVTVPLSISAQVFEVRGRMVYEIEFGREHVPVSSAVYPFRISVSGSNWLIRTSTSIPPGDHYWEVAHDGKDLFTYQYLTPAPKGGDFGFNGSGRVERNDTPPYDASFSVFAWLTYGSAKALPKSGQGQLQPITLVNDLALRLEKAGVRVEWRELLNSPGLANSVRYIDSGVKRWRDGQGVLRAEPRPGIYSTGYVAATYQVLATTNVDGMVLPSEALIQQFEPKPSGDELVRLFTVRVL